MSSVSTLLLKLIPSEWIKVKQYLSSIAHEASVSKSN